MTHIYFVSPKGGMVAYNALRGVANVAHWWNPHDNTTLVIGVVEVNRTDPDMVAAILEAAGVEVLPDHKGTETISAAQAELLKPHITADTKHTTRMVMAKIFEISGYISLKIKRF
jgi:hypothetical protein